MGGQTPLGPMGIPSGDWVIVSSTPTVLTKFPNFAVSFEIEDSPSKGLRARFGFSLIYFSKVQKIDPSTIKGLHPKTA